jgi:hypothetical protein
MQREIVKNLERKGDELLRELIQEDLAVFKRFAKCIKRQCSYNVKLRRVRVTIVAVEKQ